MSQSNDRLDQELATWFAQRGVAWSGTATELLTSIRTGSDPNSTLWPESSRGLYDHLRAHRELLRALGVDVLLSHGIPRMVSLRPCPSEPTPTKPILDHSEINNPVSYSQSNVHVPTGVQGTAPATQSEEAGLTLPETFREELSTKVDRAERNENRKYSAGSAFGERVFGNTGEALVAIGEMRQQIRELDLESAVGVVIGAALEITRCFRIVVGFLPPNAMGSRPAIGGGTGMTGLPIDADLFQSRLAAGDSVQLQDAQKDPTLGPKFRREGIGSAIIVPIFRDRKVAGSMEFLFCERRKFSDGDVMDLGLIAAVVSESLSNVPPGVRQSEGRQLPVGTRAGESRELEKVQVRDARALNAASLERSNPKSGSPPPLVAPFWRALRRVWTGNPPGK